MDSDMKLTVNESDLLQRRIGKHTMFLDKTDTGISQVLIKHSGKEGWAREPEFMEIINEEVTEGMVAFDLGANVGLVTLLLADLVGEGGHVYAVEPSPCNFDILNRNIKQNNYSERVSASQVAISNTNGTSKFFISTASNLHGLLESRHTENAIDVKVQMADDFFKDKPLPNFIKMDIEGAEVEAIEGMLETLKKANSPVKILIETHPMYYTPDRALEPKLRTLLEYGFNIKYVITTGQSNPPYFAERGYTPSRIFKSSTWNRSIFSDVSNEDAIDATCGQHRQIIKRPLRSCLSKPWLFFNRSMVNNRIVRGIFLEK